jgi:hypothetical protein
MAVGSIGAVSGLNFTFDSVNHYTVIRAVISQWAVPVPSKVTFYSTIKFGI